MPLPAPARPPHAVVIGASLAGLAAAEALGRHVERVTLVERDDLPTAVASLWSATDRHHQRALRRVLASPRVVVRSGLEASGVWIDGGRVRGVHVRPRWLGSTGRALTIEADLVVEASGLTDATQPVPDGLLVIGAAAGGTGPAVGGRARAAALVAAVLDRCLTEHLSRSPDLTGLSVLATTAVARSGAATPDGHEQAGDAAVEAC
ncbi:MAG TPA: NAD(P)-binding protein [Acidimicrobiales bacterium]|nr:NAD(P)-binding protein [Acidimicrobiales bacterium]